MNYQKLAEASKALERAAMAAYEAIQYPHSRAMPCTHQMDAAKSEVKCAQALIQEANAGSCVHDRSRIHYIHP